MGEELTGTEDEKLRGNIASKVLKYGTVALGLLAAIIIIAGILMLIKAPALTDPDKAINLITSVFYSLLPVIATWVGTVIAFYFGKANFESANKSVQALVKQITSSDEKLRATKVDDDGVMRLLKDISYNKDIITKEDKDINVQTDLIDCIDTTLKGDRLPIINDKNVIRYILHESTLNEFARKLTGGKFTNLADKKLSDLTLEDLIMNSDDDLKSKILKSCVFVAKNSTLFDASSLLLNNPLCQDVFVTENGNSSEPIIGWITNNKIAEKAKV